MRLSSSLTCREGRRAGFGHLIRCRPDEPIRFTGLRFPGILDGRRQGSEVETTVMARPIHKEPRRTVHIASDAVSTARHGRARREIALHKRESLT